MFKGESLLYKKLFYYSALGRHSGNCWYPWLKNHIETKGYSCYVPTLPDVSNMSYDSWEKKFKSYAKNLNSESVVIAHSIGSIFLVHYLVKHKIKIQKFIGVVSFNRVNNRDVNKEWDKINETFFIDNLEDLKIYAKQRICFYSPTDIYDFNALEEFANKIDAKKVIIEKAGHFTAVSGYGEKFEEILKYID